MKNKIKMSLILMMFFMLISIVSKAVTDVDVYLESDKEDVEIDDEIEISFNLNGDKTAAYLLNIYFDDTKLEVVSVSESYSVENGTIKILWYDENGGSSAKDGALGSVKLKAIEEGRVEFAIDGELYDENCELIETDFEALELQIGRINEPEIIEEENTNLETLAIENEIIYPAFSNDVTEYSVQISNETTTLNILAIPEDEEGEVKIDGNENLVEGDNLITISVTSPNGEVTKEYQINVYKRNYEEELEYEDNQDKLEEELENAYETEKISVLSESEQGITKIDSTSEQISEVEDEEKYGTIKVLLLIILIMLVVCTLYTLIEHKIHKK